MVQVRLKPLQIDEDILDAIFHQLAVTGNLTAVRKDCINKLLVDFAKCRLITRPKPGPDFQPMSSIFDCVFQKYVQNNLG